jgi:carbon storage regulator
MLVLTRKRRQEIIIGDNIRVVIVDVDGDRVRVGIEAPLSVPVKRKEIAGKEPSEAKDSRAP